MNSREINILKGRVWELLETYLSSPGCDLEGNQIDLHGGINEITYCKSTGSCKLTPQMVARLTVTNAFAQCWHNHVIAKADYYFVKGYCLCDRPKRKDTQRFNGIMNIASLAMCPVVFPQQWALITSSSEVPTIKV